MVFDIIGAKAVRAVLQEVTPQQCIQASKKMMLDAHPLTGDDVQAIIQQYVVTLRKLSEAVNEKPKPTDSEPETETVLQ
jgi:hypothetical protein